MRSDLHEGRWTPKHLWAQVALRPGRSLRAEWLVARDRADAGWGSIHARPGAGIDLAAGAVVARHPPALFAEALGLARPLRAPRSPGLGAPELEGPRGASSPAVRGAAIASARGDIAAWALAGRGSDGAAVRAGGLAARRGALALAVAGGGIRGARRAVSTGAGWSTGGSRFAAEALLSPERGPELLAEAVRSAGPIVAEARWRRRPPGAGEARPVAAELALGAGSGAIRTRLAWRAWSARASGDDGRVELDTSVRETGRGSARLRLGSRSAEATDGPGASRGERYAIADIGVARERGRSFSLLLSAREQRRVGGSALASALGGRLTLSARGRWGAVLVMQARRAVVRGGLSADAPAAWTAALAPSGAETLASRSGSGIVASGRAWVRLGGFRLEALVSDAAAAETEGSSAGSLRIEWGREEP